MRSTVHQVQLWRLDFSSYTYSVNDDNILKCNTTYSLVLDDSKMLHSKDSLWHLWKFIARGLLGVDIYKD